MKFALRKTRLCLERVRGVEYEYDTRNPIGPGGGDGLGGQGHPNNHYFKLSFT